MILSKIGLFLGINLKTKRNKLVYVRKRLLHKGYQISTVTFGKNYNEDFYSLLCEPNNLEEVKLWLANN